MSRYPVPVDAYVVVKGATAERLLNVSKLFSPQGVSFTSQKMEGRPKAEKLTCSRRKPETCEEMNTAHPSHGKEWNRYSVLYCSLTKANLEYFTF